MNWATTYAHWVQELGPGRVMTSVQRTPAVIVSCVATKQLVVISGPPSPFVLQHAREFLEFRP
jgi:hypothetical protein